MSNTSKSEINLCGFKGNKKEMQREKKSLEIQSKTGLEMQREKKKIWLGTNTEVVSEVIQHSQSFGGSAA